MRQWAGVIVLDIGFATILRKSITWNNYALLSIKL